MSSHKYDLSSLTEIIPNAAPTDISSLIADISALYDSTNRLTQDPKDWIPSKETIIELMKLNLQVSDLSFCISDFKKFAQEKGWGVKDNLDAKLITHVKILESNGRVSFLISE